MSAFFQSVSSIITDPQNIGVWRLSRRTFFIIIVFVLFVVFDKERLSKLANMHRTPVPGYHRCYFVGDTVKLQKTRRLTYLTDSVTVW